MTSRNQLTMCRLCLSENECFINIFELNDWQGYVAAEVISNLLQFQVSETDGYPHVVCSTCLTKLTDFKLFKECCQKSKVTYDKMFVSKVCLEEHKPEMGVGEGGCGSEISEQDPLKEETSDPIIKEEELDIDCTSGDESYKPFEGTITQETVRGSSGSELSEDNSLKRESSDEEEEEEGTAPEIEIGGGKGGFECHCCKKVLTTKIGLKQHLAIHGIGTFPKCKVCGKMFVVKKRLAIHSRTHKDEGPHKCTECSARFSTPDNLQFHMRVHRKTKPYKCDVCNISYRYCSAFKRHMKIHSVSKSYSCVVCHANFRQRSNLTNHMKIHSGKGQHICVVCSKEFTYSDQLRRHIIQHSEDKPPIDTSDHR